MLNGSSDSRPVLPHSIRAKLASCVTCGMAVLLLLTRDFAQDGMSPLMFAAKEGHLETVKMLLSGGADGASESNVWALHVSRCATTVDACFPCRTCTVRLHRRPGEAD